MLGDCSGGDTDGVPLERRHIPFVGDHDHAKEPYAFYDTSFYAIGLSPPRYDRGNGGFPPVRITDEEAKEELQTLYANTDQKDKLEFLNRISSQALSTKDYTKQPPLEVPSELRREVEREFDALVKTRVIAQPNTGISGSAYRMKADWSSISEYAIDPTKVKSRSCEDGPTDLGELEAPNLGTCQQPDNSWDRNYIPDHVGRCSMVFFSRSRTLVADEEPRGYRKPFLHDNELAFWGAFKTLTLRNVELTGPYMHNGILKSLSNVIDFYNCAGFLAANAESYPDKHPEIVRLDMTKNDRRALEFFLLCLTDERVRHGKAPFDHPSINVVNGYAGDFSERILHVEAVGREGHCNSSAE